MLFIEVYWMSFIWHFGSVSLLLGLFVWHSKGAAFYPTEYTNMKIKI